MGALSFGKYLLKQFKKTVINDIYVEIFFFTMVATMVYLVSRFKGIDLGISNQLLTVLGTILGLVVSFRTSSAYDRYWEGRKLWSSISLASRNLTHIIWIHVPVDRKNPPKPPAKFAADSPERGSGEAEHARLRAIIEKRSIINLIQAYSVSIKHFLRGEPGIYYADLYPLVSFLPRYADGAPNTLITDSKEGSNEKPTETRGEFPLWQQSPAYLAKQKPSEGKKIARARTFDPEQALPQLESEHPLRPARNPPKHDIWDLLPFLLPFRWLAKMLSKRLRDAIKDEGDERTMSGKRKVPIIESNVPLEIHLFLSSYLAYLLRNGLLQASLATAYVNQLQALQDCLTHLHRVRTTPIPFAYQVHLRMSIWLYLTLLPFQIFKPFDYLVIPATCFASFLILGFLEIGQEIENPFSYEGNDLDLDGFCLEIQRELHEITAHTSPEPQDFMFTDVNVPFAPADRRTASDLINDWQGEYLKPGNEGSVNRTFLRNWREINEVTREHKQW